MVIMTPASLIEVRAPERTDRHEEVERQIDIAMDIEIRDLERTDRYALGSG